jgi:type II secretory pathway pseudopilin PulG
MGLQGQQGRRRPDAGYAMAALLVMIGVMAIVMAAVLPVWRHEAQREKEAELVFRGQQWVRAIRLYQSRFQTFPPGFDVLVSQRFIRKKFKDPITGEDFQPLYAAGQAGANRGGGPAPGSGSFASSNQGVVTGGGIIGVTSKSKDTSIRVYNGATHYNEWQFVYVNTAAGRGQFPGGRPGGPGGRPGQPPNPNNPGFPGGPGRGPGGPGRGPGGPGRGFGTPGVMPFPGMPPQPIPGGGRGGRGGG